MNNFFLKNFIKHIFLDFWGLFLILIFNPVFLLLAKDRVLERYEPSWESLVQHQVPEWLQDAKFGIYAHWGLYSVPAYGNEWYGKRMYDRYDPIGVFEWHRKHFGDQSKFGYKDFIPMFKAEKFNPEEWAELITKSGAKYAGIAVVHHDGFGLWDSDVNRWNVGKMGPMRDLYGELVRALRKKKNMKVIATFHHFRTFDWYLPSRKEEIEKGREAGWDLFNPKYSELYWNRYTGKFEDFLNQWQAKVKEVIDKYKPDVIWFDGGKFREKNCENVVLSVLSYYLNKGIEWGKEVEVLNKFPSSKRFNFPREFGMLTFEEGRDRPECLERPWVDDMKISTSSWGYIRGQTYKSVNVIIDGFVDRVSRGGGLLLSLCPKADGTITDEQQKILLEIGEWLRINGEAIYGTRPWIIHAEGSIDKISYLNSRGHRAWRFDNCSDEDIRFTTKGNNLYAIVLDWPKEKKIKIKTLNENAKISTGRIKSVTLLGAGEKLKWSRDKEGLIIELPDQKPCNYAYAFKIEVSGKLIK